MRSIAGLPALNVLLAGIAVLGVGVPALIVANAPTIRPTPRVALALQRVVPPVELPPVEPTRFVALAPEDARSFNETVPFSTGPNPAARPFRFAGAPEDLARATDCLAAGVLYEAGDDAVGERAVAQVVINRLRHPAYPKTVCGVVFQGHERSTGCQFTFTCDGAIARPPSEGGWRRAREIAAAALKGSVYRAVGHATHYHTDWVIPYWSSSLDKIVRVGTHLFFRWSGWWGTPPAFNRRPGGPEPSLSKLAFISDAHKTGDELIDGAFAPGDPAALTVASPSGLLPDEEMTPDRNSFLMTMPANIAPDLWPEVASRTCDERPYCKVLAWTDAARTPRQLPLTTAQVASMSFSFLRDRELGVVRRLWNCREHKRPVPAQCMRTQVYMPAGEAARVAPPPVVSTRGPAELDGVRRRVESSPAPAARPTPSTQPPGRPAMTGALAPKVAPAGVMPPGTSPAVAP